MKYLIDTCVISEIVKPAPDANVLAWLNARASVDLYLPVVTLGEIRKGIERARPTKPESAARLDTWLATLLTAYEGRLVPLDSAAADLWGRFMALAPQSSVEDAQIAAIAAANGMVVVTRNVGDFTVFGVPVHNPF